MSLKISNRATPKQEILLKDLGYYNSLHRPLTQDEAAQLIEELFEQKRQEEKAEEAKYGNYDLLKYSEEELDDPFSDYNKRSKGE